MRNLGKREGRLNRQEREGRDAWLGTDPGRAGGSEAPPRGDVSCSFCVAGDIAWASVLLHVL